MKKILLYLFLLFLISSVHGQTEVDSLERALKNAKNDTVKIKLLIQISDSYLKSDNKKALEYAQKAEEINIKRGTDKYKAQAYRQISLCNHELFNIDEALKNIEKAITIYKQIKDEIGLVDSYNIKGSILGSKAEFTKAVEIYNLAIALATKLDYKSGLSQSYISLGLTY